MANENKLRYEPIGPGDTASVWKGALAFLWDWHHESLSLSNGVSRQTGTRAALESRSVAASLYESVSELSSHKNETTADMIVVMQSSQEEENPAEVWIDPYHTDVNTSLMLCFININTWLISDTKEKLPASKN